MIKFIIKKVLFLFLLLLLSNWGPCNRQEELDTPLNVKILEKKSSETDQDQKENQINEMIEKIKGNLNFLSGKEKDILKILFHSNLKLDSIQFDIENIKIHFSKQGNYDPNYYIKQFKENPGMEKNILLATQHIIRNILLTTLQKNNPQKGSQNQITLPIKLSELFELRKYLVLFSEEKIDDQLLAPENLNTNLDIQNGTLDILIKKTLFTNFIHQKIHPAFLSKENKSNQDHIYTLAINKANLPNALQNNLEKLIPSNIKDNKEIGEKVEPTYANLFHHLLNNKKQFVETIYNKIYPSEKIPKIRDIKGTLATDSSFEIITNTQQQNDEIAVADIQNKDFSKANLVKDSNSNTLTLSYTDPRLTSNALQILNRDTYIQAPIPGSKNIKDTLACFQNARNNLCDYKLGLKAIDPTLSADIDNIKFIHLITYDASNKKFSVNFDLKTSDDFDAEKILAQDFSAADLVKSSNTLTLSYTDPGLSQNVAQIINNGAKTQNPVSGSTKIQDALACIQNAINSGTCDYKATLKLISPALTSDIDNNIKKFKYPSHNQNTLSYTWDLKTSDDFNAEKILAQDFSAANLVKSNSNTLLLSLTDPKLSQNVWNIIEQEINNISNPVPGSTKIKDALACIENARNSGTCDYKATLKAITALIKSSDIDNIKSVSLITYNNNRIIFIFRF